MAQGFSKLTRPAMRKLKPGDKPITENGIIFERLENGDGLFTVNIMVDGQRIHRTIGRESDGTTVTQAQEFIAKTKSDAKSGRLNLPKGRKISMNLRDAFANYLSKLEASGGCDIPKKRERFNLNIEPFLGGIPLAKISSFDIDRFKKHRTDQGAASGTINRELAVISHLLHKSEEWGWIDRRSAKIRRLREDRGRVVYLTVDQANRLKECAKQDHNSQMYPFIFIALETSMRAMEILSIRREHVDVERKVISIPKAKAGSREQPITPRLAEFLPGYIASLPDGCPWLFPSKAAKSGHTMDIRYPYVRVVQAAELNPKEVLRHTLRHTAVTHMVQDGIDLPTVGRISGHKTLAMVARYSHQNGEHLQTAMERLQNRYEQAG